MTGRPIVTRGPDGLPLCANDLPRPDGRWTPWAKARLVCAVDGGIITREEAMARYAMSPEELDAMIAAYRADGTRGLRTRPWGSTIPGRAPC